MMFVAWPVCDARAIASGALDDEDDLDAEFTFGLRRILDGVEVLIREQDRDA